VTLRRFALVAGANDGGHDRVTLRYANSDARAMSKVLTQLGGVDPRDVLVTRQGLSLDDLTSGDRIGTNSPRRRVQLQRLRPDLQYAFLRGNIDTRIAKLERGDYQAIVLAHAGLRRLGLASRPLAIFSVDEVIPAVGQGILALETRADDPETRRLLVPLENAEARAMAEAERAYLHALGGDCNTPLAGHARLDARTGLFRFDAMVGSPTESLTCVTSVERYLTVTGRALASQTRELGREAAHALLDQGARAFIEEARVMARPGSDPRSN